MGPRPSPNGRRPPRTHPLLQDHPDTLHARFRGFDEGAVADCIPEQASADPDGFGLGIANRE